jgi:hypothetical protein
MGKNSIGVMPNRAYPVHSYDHGSTIITMSVGKDKGAQKFTIHKTLLCLASKYFDGALNNGFKESLSGLELTEDCPFAFEVLYQWLYSGKIMDEASWYTNYTIRSDLFWLKVYKLGDCRLAEPLVEVAYDRLRSMFASNQRISPTVCMLLELYDEQGPQHLQRYITFHTAYQIRQGLQEKSKPDFWKALESDTKFGGEVASRLMDMHVAGSSQEHPSTMKEFGGWRPQIPDDIDEAEPKIKTNEDRGTFLLLGSSAG